MSQDKKFYVYVHKYASGPKEGQVFYVGKGSGNRIKSKNGRNAWWVRIVEKYGYTQERIKDNLPEECAMVIEKITIFLHRKNLSPIVNMSDGGMGSTGHISPNRRVIYCSNGMKFKFSRDAIRWLRDNGHRNASQGRLSSCATGHSTEAYGYNWSYLGVPKPPVGQQSIYRKALGRRVFCGNGMVFESVSEAAEWVSDSKHCNASRSAISACASGKRGSAYGYTWSYFDDCEEYTDPTIRGAKKKTKPVICLSNGMKFESSKDAAAWLVNEGFPKASISSIHQCCSGKNKTAYGYSWKYLINPTPSS